MQFVGVIDDHHRSERHWALPWSLRPLLDLEALENLEHVVASVQKIFREPLFVRRNKGGDHLKDRQLDPACVRSKFRWVICPGHRGQGLRIDAKDDFNV
ncbi:hypothetical protein D9M68_935350 [compost metagenome]